MTKRKRKKAKPSHAHTPPKRGIGLMAGAVVIGLLALVGAYFLIFANNTQTPTPAAPVAEVAQPQAAVSAAENVPPQAVEDASPSLPVAPQIGALAPDFMLADTEGNQVSLADYRGRPVVVSFFHTW